ncbi:hypothetical protein HBI56_127770 [Parastagonospora nodorum]|nr:hypothetical protein HBH54_161610 [Parastagonospora nodorum]KAH3971893.1 hypothetical protein HBH51_103950 [Parastagonospora nodorum]KAH3996890.1 hypothetical protein HBI10_149610 [Parastagonospora nodorum]KAH4009072.1 hypothetical protein HBI13_223680 [Parastagonospora nodorum]KAH4029290.1 hypothetical protein HBI09_131400 [Parastagonospora nodorum]
MLLPISTPNSFFSLFPRFPAMAPKSMMSHTNPATPTAHATPFVAVRTTKAPATRMSQTTYAMPMVFAKISRLLMAQTVA